MSKLSDYSKFDNLNSDDEDDESSQQGPDQEKVSNDAVIRKHDSIPSRFVFEIAGNPIYQWKQSLSEVTLYIPVPPVAGKIHCNISANRLQVKLVGAPRYFLDETTFASVDTANSTWCIEDDDEDKDMRKVVIYLFKAAKGVVWQCAVTGKFSTVLDPVHQTEIQKDLMLERWQEENPGMDFRGAKFNGSVPDPRSFMGGVKYD